MSCYYLRQQRLCCAALRTSSFHLLLLAGTPVVSRAFSRLLLRVAQVTRASSRLCRFRTERISVHVFLLRIALAVERRPSLCTGCHTRVAAKSYALLL